VKHDEAAATGDIGSDARARLDVFARLLVRWNPTIKLVSDQDIANLWTRHIADALQIVRHIPPQVDHAIDLGSGGGFPGLVLALATNIHFDLIEADSRKAAFLQEAVTLTKTNATVHANRAQEVALPARMLITARALAPLPRLLELAQPFVAEGGICLFPKGEQADLEIRDAHKDWIMDLQQIPSSTSSKGRVLRVSGLCRRETVS
jgi:16S rRNA (guanine527-N7)-methyltransferase